MVSMLASPVVFDRILSNQPGDFLDSSPHGSTPFPPRPPAFSFLHRTGRNPADPKPRPPSPAEARPNPEPGRTRPEREDLKRHLLEVRAGLHDEKVLKPCKAHSDEAIVERHKRPPQTRRVESSPRKWSPGTRGLGALRRVRGI